MLKKYLGLMLFLASFFGLLVGWFASEYWQQRLRKIQSGMALITAQEAAQNGDCDLALENAAYALAFDKDSSLADIQIREIVKRRADQKCNVKQHASVR